MRKLFIVFFILAFQIASCAHKEIREANAEITKTVCSPVKLADEIRALRPVVPGRLYHVGRTDHLYKNIAEGNVPQDDWDKFIMKGKSRYNLASARRGLYGTVGLDTNTVGNGVYNWVMEIELNPECRKPERVATLEKLFLDQRFIDWFPKDRRSMTFEEFQSKCVITIDNHSGYGREDCEEIAVSFLRDLDIFVVQDHIMGKSFYIRNRECIRDISGTPDEWMEWLTEMPSLWPSHCTKDHRYLLPGLLIRTLINKEGSFTSAEAVKLRAHLQTMGRHKTSDAINAVVLGAIDARLRCGRRFKEELLKILPPSEESFEFYLSLDPKTFEGLCRPQ